MNKKSLMLIFTFLMIVTMAAPMVGAAEACGWGKPKTVDVYERIPGVDPPTAITFEVIPGESRELCDGNLVIEKGKTLRAFYGKSDDWGPLGYGTEYLEQIIDISRYSGDPYGPLPGNVMSGWGIYKYELVIDDGPYGSGTFEGYFVMKKELDFSGSPPKWEIVFTGSLRGTDGNVAGFKVKAESYWNYFMGQENVWYTKTTVIY